MCLIFEEPADVLVVDSSVLESIRGFLDSLCRPLGFGLENGERSCLLGGTSFSLLLVFYLAQFEESVYVCDSEVGRKPCLDSCFILVPPLLGLET